MKKQLVLCNLFFSTLLFASACADTIGEIKIGQSHKIDINDNISYSITLLDLNESFLEINVKAQMENEYYFYDSHTSDPYERKPDYYDLAIINNSKFDYCLINNEDKVLPFFNSGGTFYGVKETFNIKIDEESLDLRLYFQETNKYNNKITLGTTLIYSPSIIKYGFDKEDESSHSIVGIKILAK